MGDAEKQTGMEKSKGRILIVDDDPHAVEILTRLLGREGYTCMSAVSGAAGLEALQQQVIDVMLLDVMMPVMDGFEVCARMREDAKMREVPVILLTAKDDMETRAQGMALGVSEYLTKPINKRELFTRIEAQLHAREIDRKLSETVAAVTDPKKLK